MAFVCLTISHVPPRGVAIPASPHPIVLRQPDGLPIRLHVRGDEFFNWFEDRNGFTVIVEPKQQRYVYAKIGADGRLVSTGLTVGRIDPRRMGLRPGILPSPQVRAAIRESRLRQALKQNAGVLPVSASGTVKNLVVLCKFSDHTFGVHTRDQADYDTLFNTIGGDATLASTGSVRDCFTEMSYGTMTLDSTVVAWVTLPQTQAYYGNGQNGTGVTYPQNAQGMVRDALDLVNPSVNFADFDTDNNGFIDAISIVHSGYGAETGGGGGNWIWSHRWSLWALPGGNWSSGDLNGMGVSVKVSDYHTEPALWGTTGTNISRIGVIVHETGHFFGLPDLYDTDGTSRGIGSWCMMANSWGFDGSQLRPPHFSAWCKISLGWVTPTVISAANTYTAPRVQTTPTVFRVNDGFPSNEYLLIENRQAYGYDSLIPQGGLAIWHIDDNKSTNRDEGFPGQSGWPGNNNHYKVALLQADGNYNLERNHNSGDSGDLYHGGGVSALTPNTTPNTDAYQGGSISATNHSISAISASGTSMTFAFNVNTSLAAMTSPADGSTLSSTSVTFQWSAGVGVAQYAIEGGTTQGSNNLFSRPPTTATSTTISFLPNDGSTIHVRLWSQTSSGWQSSDYSYTAVTGADGKAAMTSPANGSTFASTSVTFQWSAGAGIDAYALELGTAMGSGNLHSRMYGSSLSATVGFLPNDGSAVHARLWSRANGIWQFNDYAYTAFIGAGPAAVMTSPANGSTFASTSVLFQWSAASGVSQYWLEIGSGVGSNSIYTRSQGTNTSATVDFLPNDGSAVFVRLWTQGGGIWQSNDYSYTAVTSAAPTASITSPANGSTFGSSTVTFSWTTGVGVDGYAMEIGTSAGASDLFGRWLATATSVTVPFLPNDGSAVHVRLWSRSVAGWRFNDFTYTAVTAGDPQAVMSSPINGSTLGSTSVLFQWAAGAGADDYWLEVGTTPGGNNLFGAPQGTGLSRTVSGLPNNGSTVYVRLWTRTSGIWRFNDYSYTSTS